MERKTVNGSQGGESSFKHDLIENSPAYVQRNTLVFFVNGKKVRLSDVEPEQSLMSFLRRELLLTGTKTGCDEGSCGSCTVMVSSYSKEDNRICHKAVTSCLVPVCTLHGKAVTTIEGIGSMKSVLHPVQERLVKFHGTQCGFCTPGMVMTMYTLLRNNPDPTLNDIYNNLYGNICRCTGYRSIMDGFGTFSKEFRCCGQSDECCLSAVKSSDNDTSDRSDFSCRILNDFKSLSPFNETQEPIFPPELQMETELAEEPLCFKGHYVTWYRPVTLDQALELTSTFPAARIAAGCNKIAGQLKGCLEKTVVIDVSGLTELKARELRDNEILLGAALSMANVIETANLVKFGGVSAVLSTIPQALDSWGSQLKCSAYSDFQETGFGDTNLSQYYQSPNICETTYYMLGKYLRITRFIPFLPLPDGKKEHEYVIQPAGVAETLGGHIMLREPTHDLVPLMMAGECFAVVASKDGRRAMLLNHSFFAGKSCLAPGEMMISVGLPYSNKKQFVRTYRISKRKHQAMASLSAAFVFDLNNGDPLKIEKAHVVFGGSISSPTTAVNTQTFLTDRTVTSQVVSEVPGVLRSDLCRLNWSDTQLQWAEGFILKCLLELVNVEQDQSATAMTNPVFKSKQIYEINRKGSFSELQVVGEPLTHCTGHQQATGEAAYVDDMAKAAGELFLYPVLSTRPHAKITSVEMKEALSLPGVHGYIDHRDIPGINATDVFGLDGQLIAVDTVHHCGHIICGIVATDRDTAERAVSLVRVTYEDKTPVILTIQDAIASKSFMGDARTVARGDTTAGFANSDQVLEGELFIKGQKHMYLETQSAVAAPKEDGELELFSATQMPHWIQIAVSEALGVSYHKICVRTKRLGGAFGGKEFPSVLPAVLVAVAANKYGRRVRCILNRKDDTLINGGRHPALAKYKVGFNNDGKILSLELQFYLNGGAVLEMTQVVEEFAVLQGTAVYNIPSVKIEGRACRTNLSSKGAFRAFGLPQISWFLENIITAVSNRLLIPSEKIREMNVFREGATTLAGHYLETCTLQRCWEECKGMSQFDSRRQLIMEFNRTHSLKKRGLALQPCMYPMGYYVSFLNQAGALVHIYTDGSVLVSHEGCEMGQGLNTKIKQIASETLGISYDKVLVSETSTMLVPNHSPSGASITTDLNGAAIHEACLTLLDRLRPFREADPTGGWEKWVKTAYCNRVSLSATGYCNKMTVAFNQVSHVQPEHVCRFENMADRFKHTCDFEKGRIVGMLEAGLSQREVARRTGRAVSTINLFGDNAYDFVTGTGIHGRYFSYGAACSEVEIDCLTGEHELIRTDIVMDVGRSLNPAIDIGQIEGGFVQGYGLYMMEEEMDGENGELLTDSPLTYKVPLVTDIPAQFNVALLKNSTNDKAIYSSKGIGEPPVLLSLSVCLAVREAVAAVRKSRGLGTTFVLDSPSTPAVVLKACTDGMVFRGKP